MQLIDGSLSDLAPPTAALLFSATFRKKVERLCRDVLSDAVRVVIGDLGEANTDIAQTALVLNQSHEKWVWLTEHLVEFLSAGSILIFVTKKVDSELVATNLRQLGYQGECSPLVRGVRLVKCVLVQLDCCMGT